MLLTVPQDGGNEVVLGEREFDGSGTLSHVRPLPLDVPGLRTRSLGTDLPGGIQHWCVNRLTCRCGWSTPRRVTAGCVRPTGSTLASGWRSFWTGT